MSEIEDEYTRTLRATSISRKRGHADIAIDFENQIFGFPNYSKVRGDGIYYIYESELYSIVSFRNPVGRIDPNTYKIIIDGSLFATEEISVVKHNGEEELLDSYALNWIISPKFNLSSFESKDFLEQTCITHGIWRIRKQNDSIEPWNDVRRRYAKEVDNIKDAFLRALKSKIEKVVCKFSRKYPSIEYDDVYSKAFEITAILLSGENRKHVEQSIVKHHNEPTKKIDNRRFFRQNSLHTIKRYKNNSKTTIDLDSMSKGSFKTILKFATRLDIETIVGLLSPDSFSSVTTSAINDNSERIYKPNSKTSLTEFIFGKKGDFIPLFDYLKDYFKNEVRKNKAGQFNSCENIDLDNIDIDDNSVVKYKSRRWKINENIHTPEFKREVLRQVESRLPLKQFEAYSHWLNGEYYAKYIRMRKNLERAKKFILLNKIDIPVPRSQRK